MNTPHASGPLVLEADQLLSIRDVVDVARGGRRVELHDSRRVRIAASADLVSSLVRSESPPIYGLNTGVGALADVRIPMESITDLQSNLIRSHAAGIGDPLPHDVVRSMILLLSNSLSKGYSGVRVVAVETLIGLLNTDICPIIPSRGSVGASGDLAPLAHLALALMGEGVFERNGDRLSSARAFTELELEPLKLMPKEGLALINGTHLMAGLGALLVSDAERLLATAELASTLSYDVLLGSIEPLDDRIHAVRRRPRQRQVAQRMRTMLEDSRLRENVDSGARVQEPYTLRCIPQILGAAWEALDYIAAAISTELDSVTDNPLCFTEDQEVLSGGNFHGQPLSLPMDLLAIMAAEVAAFSERRTYRLLADGACGGTLPPFLSMQPGTGSGLMILQYVAAALVAENQVLASPAGTASLPTSAGQEDYNSLGATAALKAHTVIENAMRIVATELLAGAQAFDLRRPRRASVGLKHLHHAVRGLSARVDDDRSLAPDIEAVATAIRDGELEAAVA